MRIACPACTAAYDVPDGLLAAGKPVRCAKCGAIWTPAAAPGPEPEPEPEPPPRVALRLPSLRTPEPVLVAPEDERLPPRNYEDDLPSGRGPMLGWALSLLLLVVLGIAAIAWRDAVMAAWPASERLFAALGLH